MCVGFLIVIGMGASLAFSDSGQESLCPAVRGGILTQPTDQPTRDSLVPLLRSPVPAADEQLEKILSVTPGGVVAVTFTSGRVLPSSLFQVSTNNLASWLDK